MSTTARIPVTVFYQTARNALGRLACRYADPTGASYPHDHAVCLHDEYALSADLLLRLAATIASGDESAMLELLTHTNDAIKRGKQ